MLLVELPIFEFILIEIQAMKYALFICSFCLLSITCNAQSINLFIKAKQPISLASLPSDSIPSLYSNLTTNDTVLHGLFVQHAASTEKMAITLYNGTSLAFNDTVVLFTPNTNILELSHLGNSSRIELLEVPFADSVSTHVILLNANGTPTDTLQVSRTYR